MKNNTIIAFLSIVALWGCNGDDEQFENKLFINADNLKNEVRVATDEKVEKMDAAKFSVSLARPLSRDLNISFVKSPELLETYRQAYYDPEAELLPDGHCDVSALKAVIKAGNISSADIALSFVKLGEGQGLDYSKRYVLPVTIEADGIDVLQRSKTMYFVVRKAALVNVAADMASNYAWPDWDGFTEVQDMTHFTLEALVLGRAFKNKSSVHTIMGIEDHFLIRAGDTGLATNQIQIAFAHKDEEDKVYRNNITSQNLQLKPDQWYHIAVTFDGGDKAEGADIKVYFDGKLKVQGKCQAKDGDNNIVAINSINFMVPHSDESEGKPRCFWVGYSYDKERSFDGMMAEVRVWSRALSEQDINAPSHFYKLYPDASTGRFPEDLVAYWKFNEGDGKTIKDYSLYGKDLTADHALVWYPVDLPAAN